MEAVNYCFRHSPNTYILRLVTSVIHITYKICAPVGSVILILYLNNWIVLSLVRFTVESKPGLYLLIRDLLVEVSPLYMIFYFCIASSVDIFKCASYNDYIFGCFTEYKFFVLNLLEAAREEYPGVRRGLHCVMFDSLFQALELLVPPVAANASSRCKALVRRGTACFFMEDYVQGTIYCVSRYIYCIRYCIRYVSKVPILYVQDTYTVCNEVHIYFIRYTYSVCKRYLYCMYIVLKPFKNYFIVYTPALYGEL